jgi:PilZ domain/RDD family
MQHPMNFTASVPGRAATLTRRRYRHKLGSLAYVNLGQSNGGILRDLSDAGLALQAVAPVQPGQQVQLRLDLGPRTHIETGGRVAWTTSLGMTGIEFLAPERRVRRLLQQWLFTQLLMRANQSFSADSIFAYDRQGDQSPELHFSAAARPSIKLGRDEEESPRGQAVPSGWPAAFLSRRALARLVDGLALMAAVLLFGVVALAMVQVVPSWQLALGLLLIAAGLLSAVYWVLFTVALGGTPGKRLAGFYAGDWRGEEEDQPRFR